MCKLYPQAINCPKFAEIRPETIVVSGVEDAAGLLESLYYDRYEGVILYEENITPAFLDLKTKIAVEILRKFFNYRIRIL